MKMPFFYLRIKTLAFLHVHAQMIRWDPCFGFFQKCAFLHPWRISGSSVFFENCTFFKLYFCVFLFIDQNLSPFAWTCSNDASRALFFNFSKICIFASVTAIRVFRIFLKRYFLCLFYAFFRGVAENRLPFFYLRTNTLAFLHVEAQVMPLEDCFGIFQKYAFLHPWRKSGSSGFFENGSFCYTIAYQCVPIQPGLPVHKNTLHVYHVACWLHVCIHLLLGILMQHS